MPSLRTNHSYTLVTPTPIFLPPPEDLTDRIVRIRDHAIGAGSLGDVFECWYNDPTHSQTAMVAVKAFRFDLRTDGRSGAARRELGIWRKLDHPNVVPFIGLTAGFGVAGSISSVTLWMPNGNLRQFLRKYEYLALDHRLRLALDVARGLSYLHSFSLHTTTTASNPNPIVHGNLNPSNVLLDEDFTARLTDFGCASMMGDIPRALSYDATRPGAVRWRAPEWFVDADNPSRISFAVDVYSFGCVAHHLLSGDEPWSDMRDDSAVVRRLAKGETPGRPTSRAIDDRHWAFVARCLAAARSERPVSDAIVSAFQQFLDDVPRFRPLREVVASWRPVPAAEGGARGGEHGRT